MGTKINVKTKVLAANLPIPQDDSEAREAIRELGDTNREVIRLTAEMNDKIAALQEQYGALAAPLKDRAVELTEGLRIFAEANRARLTRGGKVKYHRFATGEISWRLRPAKVTIRGKDAVIEAIKAARLGKKFLRVKEDINKDAILASKENRQLASAIKGVTVGSDGEDFAVEPFAAELVEA